MYSLRLYCKSTSFPLYPHHFLFPVLIYHEWIHFFSYPCVCWEMYDSRLVKKIFCSASLSLHLHQSELYVFERRKCRSLRISKVIWVGVQIYLVEWISFSVLIVFAVVLILRWLILYESPKKTNEYDNNKSIDYLQLPYFLLQINPLYQIILIFLSQTMSPYLINLFPFSYY